MSLKIILKKIRLLLLIATPSIGYCNPEVSSKNLFNLLDLAVGSLDYSDGNFSVSKNILPLGTEWVTHEEWDENDVFHAKLVMNSSAIDWEIRIGKGGQLYSLNIDGLGEVIPPQSLTVSPWVDEVIQATITNQTFANKEFEMGNLADANTHGSGLYYKPYQNPGMTKPFYNPLLAEETDTANKSYSLVNIAQVPNPSINKSEALQYTNYRSLGSGVIEVTYAFHNHGEYQYTTGSTPWGGMRMSKLPDMVVGDPSGGYSHWDAIFGQGASYNILDSGGWIARVQDSSDSNSMAVGIVYGIDQHYDEQAALDVSDPEHFQYSRTVCVFGDTQNEERDFGVFSIANRAYVDPGQTYFRRYYIVVGSLLDVAEKCQALVPHTNYGLLESSTLPSNYQALYVDSDDTGTYLTTKNSGSRIGYCYKTPVPNSSPLFLLKDTKNNQYVLTSDHYALSPRLQFSNPYFEDYTNERHDCSYRDAEVHTLYRGDVEWVGLLGYVLNAEGNLRKLNNKWSRLSTIINDRIALISGDKASADDLIMYNDFSEGITTNSPPEFYVGSLNYDPIDIGVSFSGQVAASDLDGDDLIYSLQSGPDWLSVDATGELYGTPSHTDYGLNTWNIKVVDSNLAYHSTQLQIYVNRPFEDSLQSHWSFDQFSGDSILDVSGNGFHATNKSGSSGSGIINNGLELNGAGSSVELDVAAFDSIDDQITISMWLKGDTLTSNNNTIFYAEDDNGTIIHRVVIPSGTDTYRAIWQSGHPSYTSRDTVSIALDSDYNGTWNHWVFTKNSTTGLMSIYLNGQCQNVKSDRYTVPFGEITKAYIGNKTATSSYRGTVDEVKIFNTELTAYEIVNLYRESYIKGMVPRSWLSDYGLDMTETAASSDIDQDGVSALNEYLAGTDPTSADSVFKVSYDVNGGVHNLDYPSVDGKCYTIWYNYTLQQNNWTILKEHIPGDDQIHSFDIDTYFRRGFYRVTVE